MKAGPPCQRVAAELGFDEDSPEYVKVFKLLVDLWDDGYEVGDGHGYQRGYDTGYDRGCEEGHARGYELGLETNY